MSRARWSVVAVCVLLTISCGDSPVEPAIARDSNAGAWRTWVIPNGAALRPAPPPANTTAEADEIVAIQQTVTPDEAAMIEK